MSGAVAEQERQVERLSRPELRAWGGFLRTHARIVRRLDAELRAAHGLSLSAYEVLLYLALAPDGRLRMCALAESLLLTPSGITRVVDRLAEAGLVERCGDEADKRGMYAQLTAEGRRRFADAQRTHLAGVRAAFLDRVTAAERAQLGAIWERLASD